MLTLRELGGGVALTAHREIYLLTLRRLLMAMVRALHAQRLGVYLSSKTTAGGLFDVVDKGSK